MANQMTEWGVGPKFTIYSVIYGVLMFGLTVYFKPLFQLHWFHMKYWYGLVLFSLSWGFLFISFLLCLSCVPLKPGNLLQTECTVCVATRYMQPGCYSLYLPWHCS